MSALPISCSVWIKTAFTKETLFLLLCFQIPAGGVFAEHPDSTLKEIIRHSTQIQKAADKFNIDFYTLSAIIFTERTLNYSWQDKTFDVVLYEKFNKNSSIGFCQIKIKTAYFIEHSFNKPESDYFPGDQFRGALNLSTSTQQLLQKLVNDSLNICYAAAYLRLVQSWWKSAGHSIDQKPEILGTLYSTGLFYHNGLERRPNSFPKANNFGSKVLNVMSMLKKERFFLALP